MLHYWDIIVGSYTGYWNYLVGRSRTCAGTTTSGGSWGVREEQDSLFHSPYI
ncbi:MAG: hypothetical protein IPI95_01235 [Flavobacteriales bacterium]|nr:hypothetical protein [Flavobacteriales bacterium]